MIELEVEKNALAVARIKVMGVGGAGGNTVNSMLDADFENVEFIVGNTDAQALKLSNAPIKLHLGVKSTKGLGTGANPELGKKAAEEDLEQIEKYLEGADVVFLTGGLGGGTGSGALPVIARALKEQNILTIAVVTKPFSFEGKRRMLIADQALETLKKEVDTLIVIPNQKLLTTTDNKVSMINAFGLINNVIAQFVKTISDIITRPGHINVDFADVKAILKSAGLAVMGTGKAKGANRAEEAALDAITSPLLENMDIKGARGVLLNITGSSKLGLDEVNTAASLVYEQAHPDASIILGLTFDESLGEEIVITIIATGFVPQQPAEIKAAQPIVEPSAPVIEKQQASQPAVVCEKSADLEEDFEESYQEPKEHDRSEHTINVASIDTNDVEIPTILRKFAQEKKSQQKNQV